MNMEKIEWKADEYTAGKRGKSFYVIFGLAVLIFGALAVIIRSWTFLAVVVLAAVALIMQSKSKPPTIKYSVSADTVKIDDKEFPLDSFKGYSFAGLNGNPSSINFVPKKRFGAQTVLHLPKDFEVKKLRKLLAKRLPEVAGEADLFDFVTQKI